MARSAIDDAIIEAVLRQLAVLDIEGKLGKSLTSEIDSLTAWRGLKPPSKTVWDRYEEIRYAAEPPPPPIPGVLTEDGIADAINLGNADYCLELHDNALSAIPADHHDRPRLEEQRRLLRQQMVKCGWQFQD